MLLFTFAVVLFNKLCLSSASIAGITYMDNFNVEKRYENINECNPLYWHPLHLPDHCTEIFETAITSNLKSNIPIRLVKERKRKQIQISSPYGIPSGYVEEVFQAPIREEISYYGHPFRKMLKLLSRDVKDRPSAATVGFMPNVGLVALYQQPISRNSEKIIKKVASAYAPDMPYNELQFPPPLMPWSKSPDEIVITKLDNNKLKKGRKL